MTGRRLAGTLVAAAVLGGLVASFAGQAQRLSVGLWLATVTGVLAWVGLRDLGRVAPVRPDRAEWPFRRGRHRSAPVDRRPRSLIATEGLLANSVNSHRAATIRLRPRLTALVDELLRTRHGIDRATDGDRAATVLGTGAWIVDDEVELPRSPTANEVGGVIAAATDEGVDR